jgi:hypothetical protein
VTVYWIDSSVLIQSRHKFFPRERDLRFWAWLDEKLGTGEVRMPHRVYVEIAKGNDWLVKWTKDRRNKGLDVPADAAVQKAYRQIVASLQLTHSHVPHQIADFCNGADGWVVAHAQVGGGIVACEEDKARKHDTSNIKIPDVCKLCEPSRVKCVDTFGMLDGLKAKFR